MPPPRNTRARILDAAYRSFYKEGFARARVEVIAGTAGVSKRTFYYHFESKDALLAAVLDAQHELTMARISEWTSIPSRDPLVMIERLFEQLRKWSARPGWQGSGFTRSVMELADLPGHPARSVARRHKAAIETWMAEELKDRGVKRPAEIARQIVMLMEGCQTLTLIHGDPEYAVHAARAAAVLIRQYSAR